MGNEEGSGGRWRPHRTGVSDEPRYTSSIVKEGGYGVIDRGRTKFTPIFSSRDRGGSVPTVKGCRDSPPGPSTGQILNLYFRTLEDPKVEVGTGGLFLRCSSDSKPDSLRSSRVQGGLGSRRPSNPILSAG